MGGKGRPKHNPGRFNLYGHLPSWDIGKVREQEEERGRKESDNEGSNKRQ